MIATSLQSSNHPLVECETLPKKEEEKKGNGKKDREGKRKKRGGKRNTLYSQPHSNSKPHITQKKLHESRLARRHLEIQHYKTATPVLQLIQSPLNACIIGFPRHIQRRSLSIVSSNMPRMQAFAAKADDMGWLKSALLPLSFGGETLTRTPGVRYAGEQTLCAYILYANE